MTGLRCKQKNFFLVSRMCIFNEEFIETKANAAAAVVWIVDSIGHLHTVCLFKGLLSLLKKLLSETSRLKKLESFAIRDRNPHFFWNQYAM